MSAPDPLQTFEARQIQLDEEFQAMSTPAIQTIEAGQIQLEEEFQDFSTAARQRLEACQTEAQKKFQDSITAAHQILVVGRILLENEVEALSTPAVQSLGPRLIEARQMQARQLEAGQIQRETEFQETMERIFQKQQDLVKKTAKEMEKWEKTKCKGLRRDRKWRKKLMKEKKDTLDALTEMEAKQHAWNLEQYKLKEKISELKKKKFEEELAELKAAKFKVTVVGSSTSSERTYSKEC